MKSTNRKAVAVGLACAAALSTVVVTAPTANAVANRRVCVYGLTIDRSSSGYVTMYAVNYKKDGGCPRNTNMTSRRAGALEHATSGKWTCEEADETLTWGVDPCTQMKADEVYILQTKDNGALRVRSDFRSFGHY
jgi:hypothetical protein